MKSTIFLIIKVITPHLPDTSNFHRWGCLSDILMGGCLKMIAGFKLAKDVFNNFFTVLVGFGHYGRRQGRAESVYLRHRSTGNCSWWWTRRSSGSYPGGQGREFSGLGATIPSRRAHDDLHFPIAASWHKISYRPPPWLRRRWSGAPLAHRALAVFVALHRMGLWWAACPVDLGAEWAW